MPHSPKDSFRILELNPDASLEAVKRSYRSLVKLWHPDRYTPGSSMQGIAQEKIKDINLAYADLCKRLSKESTATPAGPGPVRNAYAAGSATREAPPPRRPSRPVETAPPPRRPRATGRPETADQERARTAPRRKPEMREPEAEEAKAARPTEVKTPAPAMKGRLRSIRPIMFSIIGAGLVIAATIFVLNRWPTAPEASVRPSAPPVGSTEGVEGPVTEAAAGNTPGPIAPAHAGLPRQDAPHPRQNDRWAEFLAATTGPEASLPEMTARGSVRPTFAASVFEEVPTASHPPMPTVKPFWMRSLENATGELDAFTVGTTRAEVIKLQGHPDRETPSVLCYGTSTVFLAAGKVVGWYRGDTALKAREERAVAYDLALTFTIGSSKAEVLAVQGPPQHASDNLFQYGSSMVEFKEGRVVRWREGVPALRVHLMAEASYGHIERFTIGSTRAQVIAIQGPPDLESDSILQYGTAKVILLNGRVTSWQDRIGLLRARLVPGIFPRPGV